MNMSRVARTAVLVLAHGDSAMPIWGVVFERDTEELKGW